MNLARLKYIGIQYVKMLIIQYYNKRVWKCTLNRYYTRYNISVILSFIKTILCQNEYTSVVVIKFLNSNFSNVLLSKFA